MSEAEKEIIIRGPKDRRDATIDWTTVEADELDERAGVFSYDLQTAKERLGLEANWVKVIVAHIYVDHILTDLLKENLKNPATFVNDQRRKYVLDKLEVCEAMGWIDPNLRAIVKKLNSMRNHLAHQLSFQVSQKEIDDLKRLFPPESAAILKDDSPSEPAFGRYLELFLILLDINRQNVLRSQYQRTLQRRELGKAMENARRVLAKVEQSQSTNREIGSSEGHSREP